MAELFAWVFRLLGLEAGARDRFASPVSEEGDGLKSPVGG